MTRLQAFKRPAARLAATPLLLALVHCGGGIGNPSPQLAAATPAALSGNCEALAGTLAALANTRITSATTVAAGTLKVAGKDLPEHCLVAGRMHERVSAVDGKAYAIAFEMRLPKAWNGRFLYQANGGLDGAIPPAVGAFEIGRAHV